MSTGFDSVIHSWTRSHRSNKRRAHSQSGRRVRRRFRMDVTSEPEAKRHKAHEAQMIPGLSRMIFGFPNSIITKLKYCDYGTLSSVAGSIAYQVFRANSIFDPDFTGVGHQPMYRDTYASVYDQYTVIGSKITVNFNQTTTSGTCIVGIHGDDDQNNTAPLFNLIEQNNTSWTRIGNQGSSSDSTTLTAVFEPLTNFGVDTKDDGGSSTSVGSNPTEEWMFQVFGANLIAANSTIQYTVEIEYTVKFSELVTPVGS